MSALVWLLPCALALGLAGLAAFVWALRDGQFDDLEGAAWRALSDDQPAMPRKDGGDLSGSAPPG